MIPREIIYVTNVRLPTYRAHGLQIMKSCEAFAAQGVKIRLIAPRLKPAVKDDPFQYYGIKTRFPLHKVPVLELVPWERQLGSWVAYIENASFSICAAIFLAVSGWFSNERLFYTRDYATAFTLALLRRNFVFEMHDYRPVEPKWRIRFILRRARLIVANSLGTQQSLAAHYRRESEKIIALPNGVDVDFYDVNESKEQARSKLGIPPDAKVISYIGRLETLGLEKGVSLLLDAFTEVHRMMPEAYLVIAGGPDEMVGAYKKEAASLGLSDRVMFTGQLPYTSVPLLLRAVDVAVIPFPAVKQLATTASPLKVFEFMAAGKVIVASDIPSLRQYLNDSNAAFFKPGDEQDLARVLMACLTDAERSAALAKRAREDANAHTWNNRAHKILNAIHGR